MDFEKAFIFLQGTQSEYGHWEDYALAAGHSTEWVTGYIGVMLADVSLETAQQAWEFLASVEQNGWGYNALTPRDADSTAWGLALGHKLGMIDSAAYQSASQALQAHYTEKGGLTTYAEERPIRRFINAKWYDSMTGWCGLDHVCVTVAAAAISPDIVPNVSDYLKPKQTSDGSWIGYWWSDRAYTTALAAEALSNDPSANEQVEKALAWGANRIEVEGSAISPFDMAWLLRLLLLSPEPYKQAITKLIDFLSSSQRDDGSWAASAQMRIPLPRDHNPEIYQAWILDGRHEGCTARDVNRIFTTATLLNVMNRLKEKGVYG